MSAEKSHRGPSDRRSPSARRPSRPNFRSVAVVVSDRTRSQDWYTQRLGLDLIASDDHWVAVGRKGEGGAIHLCRTLDYDPSGALEPGNSGIALGLAGDFEAACAVLRERGVDFSQPPTKKPWGWYACVRDPDGNEIWLVADR